MEPPAEAARFLGGTRPVRVIRPESHPDMDLKVVEPLSAMRDPVSDDAGRRAGAVKLPNRHTTHISGVGPAMEALAERKGLTSGGGDEHTSRVSTGGSVWPAIERSVLDEVLKHHTTLVFVNSRALRKNSPHGSTTCMRNCAHPGKLGLKPPSKRTQGGMRCPTVGLAERT